MASLLAQGDVVLNCSVSEGGMANSILEALALERAVLVSDVPGNRALVEDGVTGLTFSDDGGLAAKAQCLAQDAALRRRLGQAGRALVEREYPIARELDGYLDVYRRLTVAVAST
jgi:glycosyltransferase involved in cell wall biosynthesis